ncbi:unnamed protein product, partial [marine sediment metagenome]
QQDGIHQTASDVNDHQTARGTVDTAEENHCRNAFTTETVIREAESH